MPNPRRFDEQRWLLNSVIEQGGLDWDAPRSALMIAPSGVEGAGDWATVQGAVTRLEELSPACVAVASRREQRARDAMRDKAFVSARESYFIAALYWGLAQWPVYERSRDNILWNERKVECYRHYAQLADHPIERVELQVDDHLVPGWLHLPTTGKGPFPTIIMMPGMDTFKESLVWMYGDKLLERGLAVLAIDGPGQSEALIHGYHVTPTNFAETGTACLDYIDGHAALDARRVGVFGRSFGSYAATVLAAANADRLRAAAVGLVVHEPAFSTLMEQASPTFKARFMFMAGFSDEAQFDDFMKGFDLRDKVASLTCPYLVVGGELDELSPIRHTYDLIDRIPGPTDLVVYEGERHAMGRRPAGRAGPHWYTLMADWLHARVAAEEPLIEDRVRFVRSSGAVEEGAQWLRREND